MEIFSEPLSIQHGTVHIDGRPRLLVTADYPYYRDLREHWADRLARLKSLGIQIVTAYIPWRHHQIAPETEPDFTGRTQPNRDVLGFVESCKVAGLAVILKPGPFIHAETNYGGLPDWVCPLHNPAIEPLLDAQGQPSNWSGSKLNGEGRMEYWPLPAPFCATFLQLAQAWLARVGEIVIQPNQSPSGPIVAVQIANEGIYSNGQLAPWAYDYSPSGLKLFREYLKAEYQSLEQYNRLNASSFADWETILAPSSWQPRKRPENLRIYLDWGAFQAEYMNRIFQLWAEPLKTHLPVIINQNPPLAKPFGLDAWLTRVEPERWTGVHYGFTNWVGDVSAKPSAFDRYILTAKRYPGVNLEENWGFAELYDPAYVDAATCFYQTLLALNSGATGFNIYTGVATAHADANIQILPNAPYPDAAPITENGALTPKAEIARWLVKFMDFYGEEFLACQPQQPVAWGLYLPQARSAVWATEMDHGPETPVLGRYLGQFQQQMRHLHLDYGVLNLETASPEECQKYPYLMVAGGLFMARAVQEKLEAYARNGGHLAIVGPIPSLGEAFEPCRVLQDSHLFRAFPDVALESWLADIKRPHFIEGQTDVWVRSHPQRDLHFVTLLIPAQGNTKACVELRAGARQHRITLSAAPSGGALLRIEQGRVHAAIIKGHSAFLNVSVAPRLLFDAQQIGDQSAGDFSWIDNQITRLPA